MVFLFVLPFLEDVLHYDLGQHGSHKVDAQHQGVIEKVQFSVVEFKLIIYEAFLHIFVLVRHCKSISEWPGDQKLQGEEMRAYDEVFGFLGGS